MGFGLRINFVDVICDSSLKNSYINGKKAGYEFDIRISYYRGLYLSCIDLFEVYLDGEKVEDKDITFEINGKEFSVCRLKRLESEFWSLLEPAKIRIIKDGGLAKGKHHIEVKLMFRSPYMPLPAGPGERKYMPIDSCGEKTMEIIEEKGDSDE